MIKMKTSIRNFLYGFGSVLQLYSHNAVPSLSNDIALGEIKKLGEGIQGDALKIHGDIERAWYKVLTKE